jgi:MFS family permease
MEVLAKVYPPGFDINPVVQDIKDSAERERTAEQNTGWHIILFPSKAIQRMMLVGVGTAVAQQAVGIDAIQYYLVDMLKESGIESEKGQLGILMLLGVLKLVFIVVGGKLFDRRGRKPLFMISLSGEFQQKLISHCDFVKKLNTVTFLPINKAWLWPLF